MKKILCLLMMVCLAAFLSMGTVGCQEQGPTGIDDQGVEEEMTEEDEALEEAIGMEDEGGDMAEE